MLSNVLSVLSTLSPIESYYSPNNGGFSYRHNNVAQNFQRSNKQDKQNSYKVNEVSNTNNATGKSNTINDATVDSHNSTNTYNPAPYRRSGYNDMMGKYTNPYTTHSGYNNVDLNYDLQNSNNETNTSEINRVSNNNTSKDASNTINKSVIGSHRTKNEYNIQDDVHNHLSQYGLRGNMNGNNNDTATAPA